MFVNIGLPPNRGGIATQKNQFKEIYLKDENGKEIAVNNIQVFQDKVVIE
jgi:hypothetical protein